MSTSTSKPLKPKRGTTAQNNAYTGEAYEVTLDTDKKTLVVHDGLTAGGFPLARADEVAAKDAAQDVAISAAQSSADAAQSSADAAQSTANNALEAVGSIQGFPSGTKMLFNQSAAPTGWTKQTSVNDAALRVVSGDTGGSTGGSLAFSTLFATGKTVSLSGNVGATTLTVNQMPSHTHSGGMGTGGAYGANSSSFLYNTKTGATGGSKSHTHTLAGTATIALNVKYTDVIICAKD